MPLDRMLHPRAGHSEKVNALTDFEYRVWTQYMLSADDFSLMPCEGVKLQADNRALAKRPARLVQKALEQLVTVGLLVAYLDPQRRRYVCDPVWQKYQRIEYPKQSIHPPPPAEVILECHLLTQELFRQCFGQRSARFRLPVAESSANSSRTVGQDLPRAGAPPETANGKRLTAEGEAGEISDPERLTDAFRAKWRAAYGVDCSLLLRPMEYSNLAQQLDAVGPVRLMAAMTAYFATEDTYIRKARHPLALFLREPLKYLAGEAVATGPPKGCRHQPPCRDDAEHTKRDIADRRAS